MQMTSAWLLPEHIADVLPAQAQHIEKLRRDLLDVATRYGYELVIPPLLEHLDSLLSGTGQALNIKTFKLVDQLSGRTLGVRADTTPQVARIDAHLLNRSGPTRLCYCGPVLHTRPSGLYSTREPLQFGAEIYGHAGLEADLEALDLAMVCLTTAGIQGVTLDLGDARIVGALLEALHIDPNSVEPLMSALAAKDAVALGCLSADFDKVTQDDLRLLLSLYGGDEVIGIAKSRWSNHPQIARALDELMALATHVRHVHKGVKVGFDLADLGGYSYYSGARFAVYVPGSSDAVVRGGRYDEVGAIFGRNRPAVGFSLDLKEFASLVPVHHSAVAIRAPWDSDPALRAAIALLRQAGEVVVCTLPGHGHEEMESECNRELVALDGQWTVRAI